jgi:NAD(P)-dependent dehydrogenase (short-subunit alcohol dehydrogenase family)
MDNSYPFSTNPEEFKNRRVLVTGGTKGAGEAMVRRFLLSGAQVATAARSSLPKDQRPTLFVQTDWGVRQEYSSLPIVSLASGAGSTSW